MKTKYLLKVCLLSAILVCVSQVINASYAASSLDYPINQTKIDQGIIGVGESRDYTFWLEEGRKYHIFLVGDWVESNISRTDYDITYFDTLSGQTRSHTEAAALPEQIWNDDEGKYYLSSYTGAHTFTIWNDIQDGSEDRSAVLMAIEHIETDQIFTKYFKSRSDPGDKYEWSYYNPWGWEFETKAKEFEVYVIVPDSLDMFELRLYPMAKPSAGIGYNLTGVGTPSGSMFWFKDSPGQWSTFGGYNLDPDIGFRNLIASCEYPGEDMKIRYGSGGDSDNPFDDSPTIYYMVMIAELFEGEVEFFIKTDFTEPTITDVNQVVVGESGSTTELAIEVDSKSEIKEAYIEYSTDGWESKEVASLRLRDGEYRGNIPPFDLHTQVDYRVIIKDVVNNVGTLRGEYEVLDPVSITFGLAPINSVGGNTIIVEGDCSIPNALVDLNIIHSQFTEDITIQTDSNGEFSYDYSPVRDGSYSASVSYSGDEDHPSVTSSSKTFNVAKQEYDVDINLETPVKLERPLVVSGRISPAHPGVSLDLIFVSPTGNLLESVVTSPTGSFTATIVTEELGRWELLPQVKGTSLIQYSTGEIIGFDVIPLTIVEKAIEFLISLTKPPLVMIPVSLVFVGIGGFEVKTGYIRSKIKRKDSEEEAQDEAVEEEEPDDPTSYRRRNSR
ncbi:MAG: Ig-like domain-containing protein [Candidatus Bathyarchaeota archaeon]|nr:Ig-like domain-containing protein [Candidatus Bathyarchaeota archaeon]